MSLQTRQQQIVDEFQRFQDWEERYKHIIDLGKTLAPYPEQFRSEDFKVKGCQSQVWLHASLNEQKQVIFEGDSDAMIVKGLVALLLKVYSGSAPDEILSTSPEFLKQIGLESHLSPSRSNGLYSMLKQIYYYATAFKMLG